VHKNFNIRGFVFAHNFFVRYNCSPIRTRIASSTWSALSALHFRFAGIRASNGAPMVPPRLWMRNDTHWRPFQEKNDIARNLENQIRRRKKSG
jgi:hypothetical protein